MDYPKSVPSVRLVGGKFVDEDPGAGTPGSLIPSAWGNAVTDEIIAVIREAGLSPDEDDAAQMVRAIRLLQQGQVGGYAADSGIANAYAATYTPDVTALTDGMVLRFKAANTNTGPSTFAPNGLEAKPIVNMKHAALAAGDIQEGGEIWLQYNSSVLGGAWVSILSLGISEASTTVKGIVRLATITESNTGTSQALAVTPAGVMSLITSLFPKRSFEINDYIRIPDVPGGLIIQWQSIEHSGGKGVSRSFNYPTPFPSVALAKAALDASTVASRPVIWSNSSALDTLSTFSMHWTFGDVTSSNVTRQCFVVSIGF